MHEKALSLERAGMFHLKIGENRDAVIMLNQSYQIYQQWGAFAKTSHLKKLYPDIKFKNTSTNIHSKVVIKVADSDSVSDITLASNLNRQASNTSTASFASDTVGQSRLSGSKRVRFFHEKSRNALDRSIKRV